MRTNQYMLPYLLGILFLCFVMLLANLNPGMDLNLDIGRPDELREGWRLVQGDRGKTLDALPLELDVDAGETCSLERTLPDAFQLKQFLLIRTSLQDVRIELDGTVLYETAMQSSVHRALPMASAWHLIELPRHANGRTLRLSLSSPYGRMSGIVNAVPFGDRGTLLMSMARDHFFLFALAALILVYGLLMTVVTVVLDRKDHKFTYLGIFSVAISLWILAESRMLQFFTGNQFLLGSLAYLMLALFPIPMLLYVRDHVMRSIRKPYSWLARLFFVQFLAAMLLQVSGLYDFFQSVLITQFLLLASLVLLALSLAYEATRLKSRDAIRFSSEIGVFLLFGTMEIVRFFRNDYTHMGDLTLIGLTVFLLLQSIQFIRHLMRHYRNSLQSEFHARLAFEDRITGGKNRMAFERDLETLFAEPDVRSSLKLVMVDLDKLKLINDRFGHLAGDDAIRIVHEQLADAFGDPERCYRLGGDEFGCLLQDMEDEEVAGRTARFFENLAEAGRHVPYALCASLGIADYEAWMADDARALLREADLAMYRDKQPC